MTHFLHERPLLVLCGVAALGYLGGQLRLRGFSLGVAAVRFTGLFVGGVVPSTIALQLARQARREAYASGGFLTGGDRLRRGERLAWTGLVLAAVAVVAAVVIGVVRLAGAPFGHDYPPNVD